MRVNSSLTVTVSEFGVVYTADMGCLNWRVTSSPRPDVLVVVLVTQLSLHQRTGRIDRIPF